MAAAAPSRSSLKAVAKPARDTDEAGFERVRFSVTEHVQSALNSGLHALDRNDDSDSDTSDVPRSEATDVKRFSNATVVMECGNPLPEASAIHKLFEVAQSTLECAKLQDAVRLPPQVCRNGWLAAKTVGIYKELSSLVSVLTDVCTEQTCPKMCAGKGVIYRWKDEETKEVRDLCAMEYMTRVVGDAYLTLSSRELIPHDEGSAFPSDFEDKIKFLLRRFFRIYAHVYLHHLEVFQENHAEAHLNHCFKHYYYFVSMFALVDEADMAPLRPLIDHMLQMEH